MTDYQSFRRSLKGATITEYDDIADDVKFLIKRATVYNNQQLLEWLTDIQDKRLIQGTRIMAMLYLACELHEKYTYDTEYVKILTDFVENTVASPQGAGELIKLAPVQKTIIGMLHGFNFGGKVAVHVLFYLVARGSGKSAMTAILALLELIVSNKLGSHISIVSPTTKQSKLMYDFATTIARVSKGAIGSLMSMRYLQTTRDSIRNNLTRSEMVVRANDASNLDGLSDNLALLDELHELKVNILPVLTQGSRIKKPDTWQAVVITTDGTLRGFAIDEMKERADKILFNEIPYTDTLPMLFSLDENDDWEDERLWTKSNSMYGHLVKPQQLRDLFNASIGSPTEIAQFKAKILNLPQTMFNQYLYEEDVRAMNVDRWDDMGAECSVGIDLSLSGDITSFTFVKRDLDSEEYAVRSLNFMTRNSLNKQDLATQFQLESANDLIIVEEELIDSRKCWSYVKNFINEHNLAPVAFMYDEWKSHLIIELAKDDFAIHGADIMPVKQTVVGLSPPMQKTKALLEARQLFSESDMLAWCMLNVRAKVDANLNTFPNKQRSLNKIDVYVSLLNAISYFDTIESTRYFNVID